MDKIELPLLKGNNEEKYIPYTLIIGIVILIILLVLTSLSLTISKTYKIHYSDNSNLDYRVYLKENPYFETPYLGKDKQYMSSLIDYIDADFDYSFKSEDNIDLDYSYYIVAKMSIASQDGKSIYDKTDYLLNKKKVSVNSNSSFNVNESVKIDYQKYNKLAKEFIERYNITSNATLTVSLQVNVNGSRNEFDKQINEDGVILMEIPLTNKTVDITMNYDLSNNKDAVLQYSKASIKNKPLFFISVSLIIIEIIAIAGILIYIISQRDAHALYQAKLNKILKDNERYINETLITERVEDMLKTKSLRIVMVKSFNDLLNIRDSLNRPILYHEEKIGIECVFYIISESIGYIYVMSVDDFKKEKKN